MIEWSPFLCPTYQMKCQVVDLMERFATNVTLERLFVVVCQLVILVVSFLMESFATEFTLVWLVTSMDAHMGIQC